MRSEHKTKVKRSEAKPLPVRLRSHRIEIAALDYGEPAPGARPMLLVHGMRDLAWSLDSVAQFFRERFRVVALDLRGHGDSDHVGYYALPHFMLDVRAAIAGSSSRSRCSSATASAERSRRSTRGSSPRCSARWS